MALRATIGMALRATKGDENSPGHTSLSGRWMQPTAGTSRGWEEPRARFPTGPTNPVHTGRRAAWPLFPRGKCAASRVRYVKWRRNSKVHADRNSSSASTRLLYRGCCIMIGHLALDFRFVTIKGLRESIPQPLFPSPERRRGRQMKISSRRNIGR